MTSRDERIETYYHQSAWELAESLVDAVDALKDALDERRKLEGDCIRLSEDLDDVRTTNAELLKDVRDGTHWEGVADRMRDEISRLNAALSESGRLREHAGSLYEMFKRLRDDEADRADRYKTAWRSARRRAKWARRYADSDLRFTRNMWSDALCDLARYRLAWLSARRRAADEANMGLEAVDHIRKDRDWWKRGHETAEAQLVWERRESARLRAEVDALRKTTDGTRLEYAGQDDDGEVWRLVGPHAPEPAESRASHLTPTAP
ncbi:hypothetical protein [Streptomyces sp. NPDC058272]|uniref:hypothetical protein n=1 Tax=Streptomyces sp. NPDC058272 TaxID=3346415 RepID=UPI0036EF170E